MKKVKLQDRVGAAYLAKTGRSDGWEVFKMRVGTKTQREIADEFGVTLLTSHRWHRLFREGVAA